MSIFKTAALGVFIVAIAYIAYYYNAQAPSISTEEQAFNESGRAKAIEQESDLWRIYSDDEAGFSFKYPHNVELAADSYYRGDALGVAIDVQDVADMEQDAPLSMDKRTIEINQAALALGNYGEDVDMPYGPSRQVRTLSGINAQDFIVFGRFEVCNVAMERKLYFIHNDTQVILTVYGSRDHIMEESAEYFTTHPSHCAEEIVWDFEKQEDFYHALVNDNLGPYAQEWMQAFEGIVRTVEVY
jgi:hypothetical protein